MKQYRELSFIYLLSALCNCGDVGGQPGLDEMGHHGARDGAFGHHTDFISQLSGAQGAPIPYRGVGLNNPLPREFLRAL